MASSPYPTKSLRCEPSLSHVTDFVLSGLYEEPFIVPSEKSKMQMFTIPDLPPDESYRVAIQSWSPHSYSNFTLTPHAKLVTRSGNNVQI